MRQIYLYFILPKSKGVSFFSNNLSSIQYLFGLKCLHVCNIWPLSKKGEKSLIQRIAYTIFYIFSSACLKYVYVLFKRLLLMLRKKTQKQYNMKQNKGRSLNQVFVWSSANCLFHSRRNFFVLNSNFKMC